MVEFENCRLPERSKEVVVKKRQKIKTKLAEPEIWCLLIPLDLRYVRVLVVWPV